MNITLIVIGAAPGYVARDAKGQYQKGDIFDVVLTSKLGAASPSRKRKFIWINVKDVPLTDIAKTRFMTKLNIDLLFPEEDQVLAGRRRWRVSLHDMSDAAKKTLRDARQITVTWEQAKPFIRDHVAARLVTDADLA